MAYNETEFLSGLTMGLTGKGVPELSGKCLYNGVELPVLPDSECEYAAMYRNASGSEYSLMLSTSPWKYSVADDIFRIQVVPMSGSWWICEGDFTSWTLMRSYTDVNLGYLNFGKLGADAWYWSNTDILTTEGAIIAAASEPVPVVDTFTRGYLLGAELRNTRPAREPVAYLYNGVRLPKLPEWDKATYPYAAMLGQQSIGTYVYRVYFMEEVIYGTSSSGEHCVGFTGGVKDYHYQLKYPELGWKEYTATLPSGTLLAKVESFTWANFDILYEDGTVCLPASAPVPVYE